MCLDKADVVIDDGLFAFVLATHGSRRGPQDSAPTGLPTPSLRLAGDLEIRLRNFDPLDLAPAGGPDFELDVLGGRPKML